MGREIAKPLLLGVVCLVVAGCGAAAATSDTPTSSPTPFTVYTPAPTPAPTLNPAEPVGAPVLTTTGATVIVEKTAAASSGNEFETPPPGGSFLAAEIKECAGNQTLFASPINWSVKLADSTQIDASYRSDMSPGPELEGTDLNPGGCTDGWIYFPIPAGGVPREIHLLRADFYWTL